MIAASKHDLDYFDALDEIALLYQATGHRWPVRLRLWDFEVRAGLRSKPRRPSGNQGQPPYANDNRNNSIKLVFPCLVEHLEMGKMESYRVIADELGISTTTVRTAIKTAKLWSDRLLRPWKCWSQ